MTESLQARDAAIASRVADTGGGEVVLRLTHRPPLDHEPLLGFLGARAVSGVEEWDGGSYRRTLRLPRGAGAVTVTPHPGERHVTARLRLADRRDLTPAVERTRRLLDLDADPDAVSAALARDPLLTPLVTRRPGLRVPGHVDGFELAVRAVLGQQVTVKGARTLAARLVARLGTPLDVPTRTLTHLFPTPEAVAGADLAGLGLTTGRMDTLRVVASAVAEGRVRLDPGADPEEARRRLLALKGIGPWTADYVAMRALGDPDAFPAADLGLRRALDRLGEPMSARALEARAEAWRPWRAYAALHLWSSLADPLPTGGLS